MSSHTAQSHTAREKKCDSYRIEQWLENGESVERVTHDCFSCGQPVRGAAVIRVPQYVLMAWKESERQLARAQLLVSFKLCAVLGPAMMFFFWLLLWLGAHEFSAGITTIIVGLVIGLFALGKFAVPAYERYERETYSAMGNMLPLKYRAADIRDITTERYFADAAEYILLGHGREW